MEGEACTVNPFVKSLLFIVAITETGPQVVSSPFHRDAAGASIGTGDVDKGM